MQNDASRSDSRDDIDRLLDVALPGELTFVPDGKVAEPSAVRSLSAGQVVDDFELVRQLGQGGMGQVWEAQQRSLGNRRIAIKFVRPDRVTERELEFFGREARAGGRLSHPGLIAVHAHGSTDGLAWIAMELVENGWTLRHSLDQHRRSATLPTNYDREVARIIIEIADAMQAAHDAGVVHRDLKPQNVLITELGRAKVTDFGLARIQDEPGISRTGDIAGTYAYMSPEQFKARQRNDVDHRTDIFSLGILMYELLTLHRPFQGDTEGQIQEQIMRSVPADPRSIRSRIPGDLCLICLKTLEKRRTDRFSTMRDLADDLQRFLRHDPILAKPPSPLGKLTRWVRRNPTGSLAAGLLGIALFAGGSMYREVQAARAVIAADRLAARETEFSSTLRELGATFSDSIPPELPSTQVGDFTAVEERTLLNLNVGSFYGGLESTGMARGNSLSLTDVATKLVRLLESIGWGLGERSLEEWSIPMIDNGPKQEAVFLLAESLLLLGAGEPDVGSGREKWNDLAVSHPELGPAWERVLQILASAPRGDQIAFEALRNPSPGILLTGVEEADLALMGPHELDWLVGATFEAGDEERAMSLLNQSLYRWPGFVRLHLTRAKIAFSRREWNMLHSQALACTSLAPTSSRAWSVLGRAHLELGDSPDHNPSRAAECYRRAIELNPRIGSNYVELQHVLKGTDEKLAVLNEGLLNTATPNPLIHLNLLHVLGNQPDQDFVREALYASRALDEFPDDPKILHNIADFKLRMAGSEKDSGVAIPLLDEAAALLNHAVKEDDRYWQVWANLAFTCNRKYMLLEEGDLGLQDLFERWIHAAEKTYELRPNDPGVLFQLINARFNSMAADPATMDTTFFDENLKLLATIPDYPLARNLLKLAGDNLGVMALSPEGQARIKAEINDILSTE